MTSYEETVVNRHIDGAWKEFAVALADSLDYFSLHDVEFTFRPDSDGHRQDCRLTIEVVAGRVRIKHGVKDHPILVEYDMFYVDEAAHFVCEVFRTTWGVIHPALMRIDSDGIELVKGTAMVPMEDVPPLTQVSQLPTTVTSESHEDFIAAVDKVLEDFLGRPAKKRDDGTVGINSDDDRVDVRLASDRPLLEVRAVVAEDVDVRRARRAIAELGNRLYFFQFYLQGDRLMMSTTVDGAPFSSAHLVRALRLTFSFLMHDAPKLRTKIERRAARRPSVVEPFDPSDATDLILLFGAVNEGSGGVDVAALARSIAGGSTNKLARLRVQSGLAADKARALAKGMEHGSELNALIDSICTWRIVKKALAQTLNQTEGSR